MFERHFDSIYSYLFRRVGVDVAGDLASETFLIAFRDRSRFDPKYLDARPWLFGIANHLALRHSRQKSRERRAYERSVEPNSVGDPLVERIQRIDASLSSGALTTALQQLSQEQREVLILSAWGEMDYEEIAVVQRVAVGTVKSRLSRARQVVQADGDLKRKLGLESSAYGETGMNGFAKGQERDDE